MSGSADDWREYSPGGIVPCKPRLAHPWSVVDNKSGKFVFHFCSNISLVERMIYDWYDTICKLESNCWTIGSDFLYTVLHGITKHVCCIQCPSLVGVESLRLFNWSIDSMTRRNFYASINSIDVAMTDIGNSRLLFPACRLSLYIDYMLFIL